MDHSKCQSVFHLPLSKSTLSSEQALDEQCCAKHKKCPASLMPPAGSPRESTSPSALEHIDSGLFIISLHPYHASIAKLKRCKSLNPSPPFSFRVHNVSLDSQRIFVLLILLSPPEVADHYHNIITGAVAEDGQKLRCGGVN